MGMLLPLVAHHIERAADEEGGMAGRAHMHGADGLQTGEVEAPRRKGELGSANLGNALRRLTDLLVVVVGSGIRHGGADIEEALTVTGARRPAR